ncbi:hypothetical protein BX616_010678 [Lobosporangium transversale]|uniref:HAD-like domain-containing protein n=1 Tax=Lobosporangium transversale TaxID=64571 RepID=A0A1Y2GIL2_9FUNG|nr:HAD-like domain-containing protein [Lobosporangium transversale]KAF9911079.1 hypothetical protein BX616_010678 [Lobosporangium transversale]ORZ10680.1 HAD-like domain-containing protein [Lobosporangium transversale]|eukprot:XP_021879401.1 HAD-like domain-containing protein [Lobosporangium transversale]
MPRIEVFSDFDGTISMEDTGCILIDSGIGEETRKAMDVQVLNHELTFLDAMDIWWSSVNLTFEEGLELVREVELDPGFLKFYAHVQTHKIPFSIVSCGLDIIIEKYMSWYLGEEEAKKLVILANYGKVVDKKWLVSYRDETPHSHDKSVCIKESKEQFKKEMVEQQKQRELAKETKQEQAEEHVIVFCGDGISDLSAAREADVLFARKGRNLEKYCRIHKIPFTPFDSFDQVRELIQGLQDGSLTMTEVRRRQQQECEKEV